MRNFNKPAKVMYLEGGVWYSQPVDSGTANRIPTTCWCPCEMHHAYITDLFVVPPAFGRCYTLGEGPTNDTSGTGEIVSSSVDVPEWGHCRWAWGLFDGPGIMLMGIFKDGHAVLRVRTPYPYIYCWDGECDEFDCVGTNVFVKIAGADTGPSSCIVEQVA
jgi:hypothetical protein